MQSTHEFSLEVQSRLAEVPLPRSSSYRQIGYLTDQLLIVLTHRASGKTVDYLAEGIQITRLEVIHNVVRNLIVRHFRDSEAARQILREQNRIPVVLEQTDNLMESIAENFHVALRKYASGPATSLWHKLIRDMPSPLYAGLCNATATALTKLSNKAADEGKPLYLSNCIDEVKQTWDNVLKLAHYYYEARVQDKPEHLVKQCFPTEFESAKLPPRENFTLGQLNELVESSRMGDLSLGLLQTGDWESMLWTILSEAPSTVQAAA